MLGPLANQPASGSVVHRLGHVSLRCSDGLSPSSQMGCTKTTEPAKISLHLRKLSTLHVGAVS